MYICNCKGINDSKIDTVLASKKEPVNIKKITEFYTECSGGKTPSESCKRCLPEFRDKAKAHNSGLTGPENNVKLIPVLNL